MESYMDVFNRCQHQLVNAAKSIAQKLHQLEMTNHMGNNVGWEVLRDGFGEIHGWRAGSKSHAKKIRNFLLKKEIIPFESSMQLKRNGFDDWSLMVHARDINESALDAAVASKNNVAESTPSRFSQNTL